MEKGIPIYMCNDCPFTSLLLSSPEQHFNSTHESIANLCEYCNLGFVSTNELNNHMITLHSLPVITTNNTASISKNETIAPTMNVNDIELRESAFNGTLKTFLIPGDNSVDILEFMSKHKEQIQNLILANGFQWPQKVQFSLNLSLQKPSEINDEDLNNPTQNELVDIMLIPLWFRFYPTDLRMERFMKWSIECNRCFIHLLHTEADVFYNKWLDCLSNLVK